MMVTPTGICVQLLQLSIYAAMYVLVHHKSKKGRTCSTELICVFLQIHIYDIRQFCRGLFKKCESNFVTCDYHYIPLNLEIKKGLTCHILNGYINQYICPCSKSCYVYFIIWSDEFGPLSKAHGTCHLLFFVPWRHRRRHRNTYTDAARLHFVRENEQRRGSSATTTWKHVLAYYIWAHYKQRNKNGFKKVHEMLDSQFWRLNFKNTCNKDNSFWAF